MPSSLQMTGVSSPSTSRLKNTRLAVEGSPARHISNMPRLVEHVVEPRLVVLDDALVVDDDVRSLRDKAALDVDHLETQDGSKPRAKRRAAVELADAFERREERLLHRLLGVLRVAQLRKRIPNEIAAMALDLGEARVRRRRGHRR